MEKRESDQLYRKLVKSDVSDKKKDVLVARAYLGRVERMVRPRAVKQREHLIYIRIRPS